ncbi:universal stress protein [Azospirillum rugosum]|uniref:Nucleotide-binding universal stress UspA family protein n=1 Tax=Azospirillum rugosum TaxID=416170 RepID=A0ABS4SW47_9PROT|nr:universal stress protein [Azospirillum rugosum]MBP2296784.1 nucleotide-binding universal stress UspA family protein [Azospirillum rugosum]MDQ0530387.1 nucleotide-binding universal stress UspA family protein [Azospirillum rugosum]
MIKHILVPVGGLPTDAVLLEKVFALARPFSAHVEVLHIRRDPRNDLPLYGEGFSAEILQEVVDEAERNARTTAAAARRMFGDAVAGASVVVADRPAADGPTEGIGVTASWREATGPTARTLAARARFADLTVLARPSGESLGPALDLEVVQGALFESGRPVLLACGAMERLDSVAIAWNGSLSSVRAVAGAMGFITRARTVSILVADEGPMDAVVGVLGGRAQPQPERLVDHLAWHGVQAIIRHVGREGRPVGTALAEAARDLNAGLLVMGGYGHSRMREIVLGGATRHVLTHPVDCAVLLVH